MSRTAEPIAFFDDQIRIAAHTASDRTLLGQPVKLSDFGAGRRMRLYRLDNGDLRAESTDALNPSRRFNPQTDSFMEGPQA